LIRVEHLSVSFDRPVLKDVSLHVPQGSLYGLIGPGASGKSVLLKALAGLVPSTSGSVHIGETEVTTADEHTLFELRKGIGMLFQNKALFDFMTVAQNVAFPLQRLFDLAPEEIARKVTERLNAVGLVDFEKRFPGGLSGGQRTRVAVARATVTRAPVLFYDEPAAGLDPVSSQKLFDLLRGEQQRNHTTVLMVSSDLDRLLSVADEVGMMVGGELIFQGTTAEAKSSTDPYVHQFIRGEVEGPL